MRLPQFESVFGSDVFPSSAILGQNEDGLIAVSPSSGLIAEYDVTTEFDPSSATITNVGFAPTDFAVLNDDRLWIWEGLQGRGALIDLTTTSPTWLGGIPLSVDKVFHLEADLFLIDSKNADALTLAQEISPHVFNPISTVKDGPKQSISNISDVTKVVIEGTEYMITADQSTGGLTSLVIDTDALEVIDHMGPKDGLFVDGVSALASVDLLGKSYVLALSDAGSLVSVRVNPMGVFFVEDQIWDDLNTRFFGAQAMDLLVANDRPFLVTSGTDQGLSIVEILPNGDFFYQGALVQDQTWDVGSLVDIEVIANDDSAQIFVSGSAGGIAHFDWDLNLIGQRISGSEGDDRLSGGWKDDLIIGGAGNDVLSGRAGDDVLIDGAGQDTLFGEDGEDVFVFVADGQRDTINGFVHGEDKLKLDGWGRIYDISALELRATEHGAQIRYQAEIIDINTKSNQPIDVGTWTNDDFIF